MRDFYPALQPYSTGRLRVSEIHELRYEEVGNPKGKPVVFLHGGPGGGISEDHRRYFDPSAYRVVLFDQRGCGQSTPFAELRENTTWDLVKDIERLREHLKIDKWHIFGGSWGSTLALCYAMSFPDRVTALILRGIFLCRPTELKWFYQEGAHNVFPEYWEKYQDFIPPEERGDFIKAYYKRLTSPDEKVRLDAARIWSTWEASTSYLQTNSKAIEEFMDPKAALPFARIECHYFMNNAFFENNNYLLQNSGSLRDIPGVIVQGRYDMVCPSRSAWELHKAWPGSKLIMIPDAGHAASEPGTRSALIEATDNFR